MIYTLINKIIFPSYSEIIFLRNKNILILIIPTLIFYPKLFILGSISLLSAYYFAVSISCYRYFLFFGCYTYNSLLVGFTIGSIYPISITSVLLTVICGILTFIVSFNIENVLYNNFNLPALTLPFTLISTILWLCSHNYTGFSTDYHANWISGFLLTLSSIFFCPNLYIGIAISALLLLHSRIILIFSLLGYYLSVLISLLLNNYLSWYIYGGFNHILVFIYLGSIFLIPSRGSVIIASLGVCISVLFLNAELVLYKIYNIPIFTLPFVFTSLSILYVLKQFNFWLIPKINLETPELNLDSFLHNTNKADSNVISINFPFKGTWVVWQGFNDQWTHKGIWQYAYDFVVERHGKTHTGDGYILEDYHCFRKEILSPCNGKIIQLVSYLPDNEIGNLDYENKFGNYVVIENSYGYFITIGHLAQNSITLAPGQIVCENELIGLCGNSGYSPVPHVHIQMQTSLYLFSNTIPFSFYPYINSNNYFFYSNKLRKKQEIFVIPRETSVTESFNFVLGHNLSYFCLDKKTDKSFTVTFTPSISLNGENNLQTDNCKLFFSKKNNIFSFYRMEGYSFYAAIFYWLFPKIPLSYIIGVSWEDFLPQHSFNTGLTKEFNLLKNIITPDRNMVHYKAKWGDNYQVVGQLQNKNKLISFEASLGQESFFDNIRIYDDNMDVYMKKQY